MSRSPSAFCPWSWHSSRFLHLRSPSEPGGSLDSWQGELADAATLQVFGPADAIEEQARAALDVLRTTPGVRSVRMVDLAEQERLLEPWLGPDIPIESLPLPLLIEIETDRDQLNQASLILRLQAEAPGAVFDDHAAWRQPLLATAERLRLFAAACVALMALALAAVLGLAAHAAVAFNGAVVETLRLVGARDRFIGATFTRPLMVNAMASSLAGTAAAMALLALLPKASEQGFFLVGIGLVGWHWLLPPLVPLAAGVLAWVATGLATRQSLRRWS